MNLRKNDKVTFLMNYGHGELVPPRVFQIFTVDEVDEGNNTVKLKEHVKEDDFFITSKLGHYIKVVNIED